MKTPSRPKHLPRRLFRSVLLASLSLIASACNWTSLVSVSSSGEQANNEVVGPPNYDSNFYSAVSGNGRYIAFDTRASNLVADDVAGYEDIFLHDTVTGSTTRVSVDSAGTEANYHSFIPALSGDGRYVAFTSAASNLVAGDTNNSSDIFLHDRDTGTTSRVSVGSDGTEGDSYSDYSALSSDGRYVSFYSEASNLVAGDTNNEGDTFVHDCDTGITTRISMGIGGTEGNDDSYSASLSGDGRFAAFYSEASNLVAGDTNNQLDVFVYDRDTDVVTRVSVGSGGAEGNNQSYFTALSSDGRYVTFTSYASNLVADDTNGKGDIFMHDRDTGVTTRISVDSSGKEANGSSYIPSLSGDGRYVAFISSASNLVAGDTNDADDIFLHDRDTGSTTRVSVDAFGVEGNGRSGLPTLSSSGRYVVFRTEADNLVPGDSNGSRDIIIRSVPALTVTGVVPDHLPIGATTEVTITGSNFFPGTIPGTSATVSSFIVVDENTITADITVPAAATAGAYNLGVILPGTGPGLANGATASCVGCITFF